MIGEPSKEVFMQRLREFRLQAGMTQTGLAVCAELPLTVVSQYERGRYLPGYCNIYKLARALNVSIEDFY